MKDNEQQVLKALYDSYKSASSPAKVGLRFSRLKAMVKVSPQETTQALHLLGERKLIRGGSTKPYEITETGIREIEAGSPGDRIRV